MHLLGREYRHGKMSQCLGGLQALLLTRLAQSRSSAYTSPSERYLPRLKCRSNTSIPVGYLEGGYRKRPIKRVLAREPELSGFWGEAAFLDRILRDIL